MCKTSFSVHTDDQGRVYVSDCPKDFPSCHFVVKGQFVECLRCEGEWRLVIDEDGEQVAVRVRQPA